MDTKKEYKGTLIDKIEKNPITELRKITQATMVALNARKPVWERYRKKYRRGLAYLKTYQDNSTPIYFTNLLYSNVETYKANMTRFLPKLVASPRGLADQFASDFMTRVLEDTLYRVAFKETVKKVVHYGSVSTFGVFKVYYDDKLQDNVIDAIAPENMLIDPNVTDGDSVRWIGNVRRDVSVDEIYAEFGEVPQKGDAKSVEVEPDNDGEYGASDSDESRGLYTQNGDSVTALSLTDNFDVFELWVRDFKNSVWMVYIWAGETILKQEESVYAHDKHPFVLWFDGEDYGADNCYYKGVGEIEEVEPLQDRVDSLDMKILSHIALTANRQKLVNTQSGLNVESVDNAQGRVYGVNGDPSRAIFYDSPPSLGQEVYQYQTATELHIQAVSGIADVTMGRRPTGVTAGRAMQTLKDSADVRLEERAETLALAIERVGSILLQNILQLFDGERLIQATDGDKDPAFVVIADYPEELQPQPLPQVDPETGMPVLDEAGQYVLDESQEPQITPELIEAREMFKKEANVALVLTEVSYDWDVRVSTDSALPASKMERAQQSTEAFRLGLIDRQAALEAMEFPGRYKILQRLEGRVTGADAGEPHVEGQVFLDAMAQVLMQGGVPEEQVMQLLEAVSQTVEQGEGAQSQTGQYKSQIVK